MSQAQVDQLRTIREKLRDTCAALAQLEKARDADPESAGLKTTERSLRKRKQRLEADFLKAAESVGWEFVTSGASPERESAAST